jgi:hypothetical protein
MEKLFREQRKHDDQSEEDKDQGSREQEENGKVPRYFPPLYRPDYGAYQYGGESGEKQGSKDIASLENEPKPRDEQGDDAEPNQERLDFRTCHRRKGKLLEFLYIQ